MLHTQGGGVVAALEVIALAGKPLSDRAGMTTYTSDYGTAYVGIAPDLAALDERMERRVDVMWERGLVDEVRALERHGLRDGVTASRALGYQQVLAFLAGEVSEDTAREDTKRATRRFARRQLSWFRRDPRVVWHASATAAATSPLP